MASGGGGSSTPTHSAVIRARIGRLAPNTTTITFTEQDDGGGTGGGN